MRFKSPQIEGYTAVSQSKGLPPRCPFAAVDRCPRYFQSLALLRHTGATGMNAEQEERLEEMWKSSGLWPAISEQATSLLGPPGDPHMFSHFCPEVAYLRYGIFASDFASYPDAVDAELAHKALVREGVSRNDLRWHWAYAREVHYSECPLYSPLTREVPGKQSAPQGEDILELKPGVFGLTLNLRALLRWACEKLRRLGGRA